MKKTTPILKFARRLLLAGLCGASALVAQGTTQIISININEQQGRRPMASTDLAGVGDFRVNNWNNVNSLVSTTLSGDDLIYNDGTSVSSSFSATFNLRVTAVAAVVPAPINDAALYSGSTELRDTGHSIVLENIPFSSYAIYVFVRAPANNRGGSVGIGSETFYVRGTSSVPSDDGTGYLRATNTTQAAALDGATSVSGNYILFEGLSGANQTISLAALNMGDAVNLRLNVTGIQIVAIPEAGSFAALAGMAGVAFVCMSRRVRRHSVGIFP